MDIHDRWSPIFLALTILSTAWSLTAYFNRNKDRKPQEGLSKEHGTTILFLPALLSIFCIIFSSLVPNTPRELPLYPLAAILCLAMPFHRISAEWIGVSLKVRQAATQATWGVIIAFVFLILVSDISDIIGP